MSYLIDPLLLMVSEYHFFYDQSAERILYLLYVELYYISFTLVI